MCLFTRPHRPTGRMNTEPSLKPAKRNNHNVSLEEKTWSISCCSPLCLSQLNFNWMCYFCDESHAFRSAPEYFDLQCDVQSVQSVSCVMSHSAHYLWWFAKCKNCLVLFWFLIYFYSLFNTRSMAPSPGIRTFKDAIWLKGLKIREKEPVLLHNLFIFCLSAH